MSGHRTSGTAGARAADSSAPAAGARQPRHRVWKRHALLVRLIVICVAIAGCSIGATAWVASVSTSVNIQQQHSDDLTIAGDIYDGVLGYAATHKSWDGVESVARAKAAQYDRAVILETETGKTVYDGGRRKTAGAKPAAWVNALDVSALPGARFATSTTIDPRAVGPFQLTQDEQRDSQAYASKVAACARERGLTPTLRRQPNGRWVVDGDIAAFPTPGVPPAVIGLRGCAGRSSSLLSRSEEKASGELLKLVTDCLARQNLPGFAGEITDPAGLSAQMTNPVEKACLDSARREQLAPYVAPPVWLYITGQTSTALSPGLSAAAKTRIGLLALLILLLTVAAGAFLANRLVRPLQALTAAAQQVGKGDRSARVATADSGQIGELASAFNRMAEELDLAEERRKQMVSDIAHELRTPLGNIRGWLEATQDGVVTFDDDLASSLLDESMLLQRIIEDLQELSLADAGKLVFHPEPIELSDLLRQIAGAHRPAADHSKVTLDVICPQPVQLTADANRLRQALGNLVSNAVRYTPARGLVILRAERAGDAVVIEVSDTGLGMTPDELEHVFDRFWRAEQSRSRLSGGSGLGLAITRHLIEAQGGTITARSSSQGGGTVFTIHLPLGEAT